MKRFILLLFVILTLAGTARATDVTVSAVTIDGFSPSNIGTDRLIAVNTAGGSPTITSSGLFTGIVGLSGFRVLIDGAAYTVASVNSTSSLTLTVNYAGTPGAQTMTLYRWVEMRVYADRAFQPLGSTQIIQPGAVGSGNFFRRFAAGVVNNGSTDQLFIPQIVIPATTDALITNQAKYSFPFYRPGGNSQLEFFLCPSATAQLALPPATPTTWTAICQFNSPSAVIPPANDAYTKAQIDARLPSCSINNGIYYSVSGNLLSCLTFGSGLSVVGNTLTATAGGSGYNQLQEEGGNITQRGILNFIGAGFTAADNAGATRSELSLDSDLNALAANATNGFWVHTGAGTGAARLFQAPTAGFTITNNDGVAGNPTFVLANDLAGVEGLATTGIATRTAADTWTTRTLTAPAAGFTITNPAGIAGNPTFVLANDLAALEGLGTTGIPARTGVDTWAIRTLTQPANGITITNPGGVAGNPTFALANDLNAVEGLSTTGLATRTAPDTWTTRTITGTANRIGVTNGDGVSGNPTLDIGSDVVTLTGTQTLTNKTLTSPKIGTAILDTNGNELLNLTATGSAVNELTLTNAATGTFPSLSASGNDSNIDITLTPKGTGKVGVGAPGASPVAGTIGGPDASGTNTAGVNLELTGGKGTGNAVSGAAVIRYPLIGASGTTLQSLGSDKFPVSTSLYTNTAIGTAVANTTTETSLFTGATASSGSTLTIVGGSARAGTVYRMRLYGTFTTTGTPTIRFKVKLGSTIIADSTAFTSPNNAGGLFFIDVHVYINAIGAAGLARADFEGRLTTVVQGSTTPTFFLAANGEPSVDFTANQTIDVTAQWGTASASNSVGLLTASIKRVR